MEDSPAGKRLKEIRERASRPGPSVLIIGGGINGAGLFRELALQNVSVILVERGDFSSGASAAATRIIHGGLRYLENGEFRLVKESVRERNRLLATAPHYVKPLAMTIPIFSWAGGLPNALGRLVGRKAAPADRGALIVKAGLTLYDFMAGRSSPLPKHEFHTRRKALELRPDLNPDIVCTATFWDARITFAERLCLELIQDGEQYSPNASAWNYVAADGGDGQDVQLRDQVSGECFTVKPQFVVNATGAWIDLTNGALGRNSKFIGGTKGSHVVLENKRLLEATQDQMLYFANEDRRVCIFYPFFDRVIAGATDIPLEGDPDSAMCEEDEVKYILKSIQQVFPTIPVSRSDVVYRFSGVRPLPRTEVGSPGQISRDHSFPVLPSAGTGYPVYSLVGGKWTTFRAFAEQVADELLRKLGKERLRRTHKEPIGGGRAYPPSNCNSTLVERYGWKGVAVQAFLDGGPDSQLESHPGYTRREIEYLVKTERVVHLDDLILRRTLIGLLGQGTRPVVKDLAQVVGSALEWAEERIAQEAERTMKLLPS